MYNTIYVIRTLFVCLILINEVAAQTLIELKSGTTATLRGLSAVNDRILWASGTNGHVGRSADGGETWTWMQIPGFEKVDFRDIEGFDEHTALVMGIGSPGYLLRTTNKGKNWSVVYKNEHKEIFLDALYFWNDRSGMAIGDPIDGRFFMLRTFNGGKDWREIPYTNRPKAEPGEACFAASGSNIAGISPQEAVFVSGGSQSRIFIRDSSYRLPLIQGSESTGANAIDVYRKNKRASSKKWIVVGGDFNRNRHDSANAVISRDGGQTWHFPEKKPNGYRSSVTWIDQKRLISCGISGVDISKDEGEHWSLLTNTGFHICIKSKKGNTIYLAGANGRIARLDWR
jgi:photosystem II stability/assembly factor-like uncharacterized protein